MNLLAIDRSTDTQSVAVAKDGKIAARVFAGLDARSAEWPVKVRDFLAANGLAVQDIDTILVGQGPGSFAGIRSALAFAQGLALPAGKRVVGLPSTLALTRDGARSRVWATAETPVTRWHPDMNATVRHAGPLDGNDAEDAELARISSERGALPSLGACAAWRSRAA